MAALDGPAPSQSCPPASGASMKPVNTTSFSASDASGPERPGPGAARSGGRRHLLLSPARPHPGRHPGRPSRRGAGVGAYLEMRQGFRVVHQETSARGLLESWPPRLRRGADRFLPAPGTLGRRELPAAAQALSPDDGAHHLSAGNRHETQYAAFRGGASGYLAKQWGMVLLPDMIRGVLSGKDAFLSVQDGKIRAIRPTPPHAQLTTSEVEIPPYQPGPVGDADRGPPDAQQEDHQHAQAPRDAQARALGRSIPGPVPARSSPDEAGAGCARASMMRE